MNKRKTKCLLIIALTFPITLNIGYMYLKLEIVESIRVVFLKMNLEAIVKLCLSIFLGQKMLEEDWNVCFAKIIVFALQCILPPPFS